MSADRAWDRHAEQFSADASDNAYNALYDRPTVLELLGDVDGLRILDVGCGPGLYASELVARGASVLGLDQSPRMVALAQARVPVGAGFLVHDLSHPLELEDSSFDKAVMALVIHHLDDRVAVLREINRVLRPGGRLVVSTHHPTTDWVRLGGSYFDVEVIEETWKGSWDVRYWRLPLSDTCAEFAEAGFLIERLVEPRPSAELMERFPEDASKLSQRPGFIAFRLLKA